MDRFDPFGVEHYLIYNICRNLLNQLLRINKKISIYNLMKTMYLYSSLKTNDSKSGSM